MPVEGVDTFSCLCVPDLECAISGAADDDVVSHLRWPYAARVAHQRAQTLKRPQTKKILDECFLGKSWSFSSNLLLLRLLREPSNCFHRKAWHTEYTHSSSLPAQISYWFPQLYKIVRINWICSSTPSHLPPNTIIQHLMELILGREDWHMACRRWLASCRGWSRQNDSGARR